MSNEPVTTKRWTPNWRLFGGMAYGQESLVHFYIPFTGIQIWILRKRDVHV